MSRTRWFGVVAALGLLVSEVFGGFLHQRTFGFPDSEIRANVLIPIGPGAPDGAGLLIGGTLAEGTDTDLYLARPSVCAGVLWEKRFGDAAMGEELEAAAATADGGLLMAGETWRPATKEDVWVVRLDGGGSPSGRCVMAARCGPPCD